MKRIVNGIATTLSFGAESEETPKARMTSIFRSSSTLDTKRALTSRSPSSDTAGSNDDYVCDDVNDFV